MPPKSKKWKPPQTVICIKRNENHERKWQEIKAKSEFKGLVQRGNEEFSVWHISAVDLIKIMMPWTLLHKEK